MAAVWVLPEPPRRLSREVRGAGGANRGGNAQEPVVGDGADNMWFRPSATRRDAGQVVKHHRLPIQDLPVWWPALKCLAIEVQMHQLQ